MGSRKRTALVDILLPAVLALLWALAAVWLIGN
jgi:hypothetical protein